MDLLIKNISAILHVDLSGRRWKRGKELAEFPQTNDAWLFIKNGRIHNWGKMSEGLPKADSSESIDAEGGMVLPGWVDSHTHIVFAGSREDEFAMKLQGMSYEEIAARGGGILNSVKKLRNTTEDELYDSASRRLDELIKMGTTAIEVKSGYGLNTESEIKMLKVARRLSDNFPIPVKTTFLGAHAFPEEFKDDHQAYIRQITDEMIPEIAAQNLADYVDVFCEKGYFSVDEMMKILGSAAKYGLKPKLHLNQFNVLRSISKAIDADALSVDHLEVLGDSDQANEIDEAELLGSSETIATLLPGCSHFLGIPYAPARRLINANAIVALATDFNPGSAPGGNMNTVVSLACIKMRMTPEETISAATLNGAAAIELSDEVGSIEKNKRANIIITRPHVTPSFLPYNFGHNHIRRVLVNGKEYQ